MSAHEGDHWDFLRRYRASAAEVAHGPRSNRKRFAKGLLERLADPRMLACAFDLLSLDPDRTPGPNGHRVTDLDEFARRELYTTLHQAIRDGSWKTGPPRRSWIPKNSGNGSRPIDVFDIEDMVVQKAYALACEPLLDPVFLDTSFGWRPHRGREDALIAALRLKVERGSEFALVQDLKDAFSNVPHRRLWDALRAFDLPGNLNELAGRTIPEKWERGIPQGACHSPLLLNGFAHVHLDRPWRRRFPETPFLRAGDDLLVVVPVNGNAEHLHRELDARIRSMGMTPKHTREQSFVHWGQGEPLSWLGYRVQDSGDLHPSVRIAEPSWKGLENNLRTCLDKPQAPLRAIDTILGWVSSQGPTFPHESLPEVYQRIGHLSHQFGFFEIPSRNDIHRKWEHAHGRFLSRWYTSR